MSERSVPGRDRASGTNGRAAVEAAFSKHGHLFVDPVLIADILAAIRGEDTLPLLARDVRTDERERIVKALREKAQTDPCMSQGTYYGRGWIDAAEWIENGGVDA